MKQKIWNPTAKTCSKCKELAPIIDPKTKKELDGEWGQKMCIRFSWEISGQLAAKAAVCKIEQKRRR
jgi:hypothetical protein